MNSLAEFLKSLLIDGSAVLRERPVLNSGDLDASRFLAKEYSAYQMQIAGPTVEFDERTAVTAAGWVWSACWFLVSHDEDPKLVESTLTPSAPPTTPAAHFAADLTLRFLPGVYRRAFAVAADDVLTHSLSRLLRLWPLSGVLADVTEAPLTAPLFEDHPGLALLYAERLADHFKPAWMPASGRAREYVELVFAERGRPLPEINPEPETERKRP
jgi:hypothetical protein